jgi:ubiquinol-cytochrome c reductase iron-sulfur subunit
LSSHRRPLAAAEPTALTEVFMADHSSSLPGTPAVTPDPSRRTALAITSAVGAVGAAACAIPFVSTFQPSERAKAAGAPVEADIAGMIPGELRRVEWRGNPVWIVRARPRCSSR